MTPRYHFFFSSNVPILMPCFSFFHIVDNFCTYSFHSSLFPIPLLPSISFLHAPSLLSSKASPSFLFFFKFYSLSVPLLLLSPSCAFLSLPFFRSLLNSFQYCSPFYFCHFSFLSLPIFLFPHSSFCTVSLTFFFHFVFLFLRSFFFPLIARCLLFLFYSSFS